MTDGQTATRTPFPLPDFDGPTAAFGAPRSAYLTREQMGDEFYSGRNPYCEMAEKLFFKGGKLADYGLSFKPGIDRAAGMRALQGLLCSFDPPHEIKIGTVGYALREWCDGEPTGFQ